MLTRKSLAVTLISLVVIALVAVAALGTGRAQAAGNILTNAGFESGNTAWGTISGNWSILQPGSGNTHAGTWALKGTVTTPSWGGPYEQLSGVPTSTAYIASFWLKGSGKARVVVNKSDWTQIGTTECTATTSWTQCSYSFNTGTNTALVIQLQDTAAGTFYIDDEYLGDTVTATNTPTNTPVQPTATRTNTPVPPTATKTPTPTATSPAGAYDDEFTSGTLAGKWSWIRQDAPNWSLTARSGYMRIISQSGDINGATNVAENILLETAPAGDFTVIVKLDGKPTANYAHGGIIVYQDDDNYVKVVRLYWDGNVFQLARETGGVMASQQQATDSIGSTVSYLKVVKSGTSYTGYYSADGITYSQVGTAQTASLSNIKIGFVSMAGTGLNADFDYIHVTTGTPPTPTNTPVGPTATKTYTPVPPTPTRTNTPVPPTPTRTKTPTPTATPGGSGLNIPPGWHQVFNDDFNTVDTNAWNLGLPYGPDTDHLNDELGCYQPGQVSASGGILHLRADSSGCTNAQLYPTGAVTSKSSWQYGYFEARIKLTQGKGFWPCFWLTSADGRWPPEWDIFEVVSTAGEIYEFPHPVSGGQLIWVGGASGGDNTYTAAEGAPSPWNWVTYGMKLTTSDVIWYVNGVETNHYSINSAAGSDDHFWVFLTFAIGGSWPGNPDGTTPWPAYQDVDYLKIWQP